MERIALLVDQIGKGDNIFENFAIEFEQAKMQGDFKNSYDSLQQKVELVERKLQDFSEKINAFNECKNIYTLIIHNSRQLLSIWLPVFSKRNLEPKITEYFNDELVKLVGYLNLPDLETKTQDSIICDFETRFTINSAEIKAIETKMAHLNFSELSGEWIEGIAETMVKSISRYYIRKKEDNYIFAFKPYLPFEDLTLKINELSTAVIPTNEIPDGEQTLYVADLNLWINTDNAVEANKFVNIVTEILGSIENVKITLVDCGKGSYWQKLKIKAEGWFAKEETKQIISKAQQAAEAYALDRHIEPVEKSRVDRKRLEEDINRLMPMDDVNAMHKIAVAKANAELESLRLDNLEKKVAIMDKMSQMLANGLVSIDSDFRIEMDGLLLIGQTNKILELGTADSIENSFKKELLPASKETREDQK